MSPATRAVMPVGPIEGGHDATHLPHDPAGLAARAARQALARANLAAWMCDEHAIDPAAELAGSQAALAAATDWQLLCEALGLAPPTGPVCVRAGCGAPIPARRANSRTARDRLYCTYTCSEADRADRRPTAAGLVTGAGPALTERVCAYCARIYRCTPSGWIDEHPGWRLRAGAWFRVHTPCPGSRSYPEAVDAA